MATITALSAMGQIVLPASIRNKMNLKEGTQFVVLSDGENILLKPVKEPSIEEFGNLIEETRKWAYEVGMKEEDIANAIKDVRRKKRDEDRG